MDVERTDTDIYGSYGHRRRTTYKILDRTLRVRYVVRSEDGTKYYVVIKEFNHLTRRLFLMRVRSRPDHILLLHWVARGPTAAYLADEFRFHFFRTLLLGLSVLVFGVYIVLTKDGIEEEYVRRSLQDDGNGIISDHDLNPEEYVFTRVGMCLLVILTSFLFAWWDHSQLVYHVLRDGLVLRTTDSPP